MKDSEAQNRAHTLCAPTPELTCFGCCPPIRPPGYDHLDFTGSLRREFYENRRRFRKDGPRHRPIVGYSCWALGFLDLEGRRVGCLLHPGGNQGQDLRFLIDYGTKCQRESCFPARMFYLLPPPGQSFWLGLAQGLNAFYFSSPRANPLFHLLLWGPDVLEGMRHQAQKREWTVSELLSYKPFLMDSKWKPKAHRYLFRLMLNGVSSINGPDLLHVENHCLKIWLQLLSTPEVRAYQAGEHETNTPYTHQLPFDADFLDLLRLGLGWRKASVQRAMEIKRSIDRLTSQI